LINFKYIISILLLLNNVYVYSKIYIYIYIINKKDILPPTGKKDKSGNNVLQDIGLYLKSEIPKRFVVIQINISFIIKC